MEYKELEGMWKEYDRRLNNLDIINKDLIKEVMAKKATKKIKSIIRENVLIMFYLPLMFIYLLYPRLESMDITSKHIIGLCLIIIGVLYEVTERFSAYKALRKIDLQNDTILESASKFNKFMQLISPRKKRFQTIINTILILTSLYLLDYFELFWKAKYFLLIVMSPTLYFSFVVARAKKQKMKNLKQEIINLDEYQE